MMQEPSGYFLEREPGELRSGPPRVLLMTQEHKSPSSTRGLRCGRQIAKRSLVECIAAYGPVWPRESLGRPPFSPAPADTCTTG